MAAEIESSFDALDEIKIFFDKANFSIEKVKISIGAISSVEFIEVNSNGTIIFSEDSFMDMSKIIEDINFTK
ncbi:hypothetical protein [Rahnella aceris]|uniref:hypothetical protein n=1 Tax=Rahnella sp. (strain Y9602) TaxID=2703885 RepID=UPI003BA355CE